MRPRGPLALAACAAVAYGSQALAAAAPQLFGTVGPGFSIRLDDAAGNLVTQVDPGTYEIAVRDLAEEHNFHLSGPGVDERTSVDGTGTVTWTVALETGRYTILCDAHASSMRRQLTVGTPPPPPVALPRLLATVGPLNAISLRSASGAILKSVRAGAYSVVVRDRSKLHNFHLVGKGVNRKTGLAATGTVTWRVVLSAGTLRFFSDRAPKTVKGAVVVR